MPSQNTSEATPKNPVNNNQPNMELKSCLKNVNNVTHLNTAFNRDYLKQYQPKYPPTSLTETECLNKLRVKEVIAYHHIAFVFRAQGHLTPEKLKLLKEIAAALYISEPRHKAECRMAANDEELRLIANCVAGPNTDIEWRREGFDPDLKKRQPPRAEPSLYLLNAAKSVLKRKELARAKKAAAKKKRQVRFKPLIEVTVLKEEDGEDNSDTCISSTSDQDTEIEVKTEDDGSIDIDKTLMPPPPSPHPATIISSTVPDCPSDPVVSTTPPPSTACIPSPPASPVVSDPSLPAVITVPPNSAVITVPPPTYTSVLPAPDTPTTISQPLSPTATKASSSVSIESNFTSMTPFTEVPMSEVQQSQVVPHTEDLQLVYSSEPMDSTLPPLVVVPPEPVITVPHSSSFPPTNTSPTLALSTDVSIQLRDDNTEAKKRKLTHSTIENCDTTTGLTTSNTIALSHISKMTPLVVSTAVTSQSQAKGSPVLSLTTQPSFTTSSVTPSAQKVIIVSNSSAPNVPLVQPSLSMPIECSVGMPIVTTNLPRMQSVQGVCQAMLRPKLMTVPARGRGKSTPLIIPLSVGNNLQLNKTFTVVDSKTVSSGQITKIVPRPQGPLFKIINTKGTTTAASSLTPRIMTPQIISAEGPSTSGAKHKHNIVFLQKAGGTQRPLTLTKPPKNLMQTLMSKKCVLIDSPKTPPVKFNVVVQTTKEAAVQPLKTPVAQSPRPAILKKEKLLLKNVPKKCASPVSTSTSQNNVVVLDLSQEQYQQKINNPTIAEILQASGILTSTGQDITTTAAPSTVTKDLDPNWQHISMDPSMILASEEVSLPFGDSESIVTLEEAVELLGEDLDISQEPTLKEEDILTETNNLPGYQLEIPEPADQIFTISDEDLSFMAVDTNSSVASDVMLSEDNQDMDTSQLDSSDQGFSHRDGAVTIQHSTIGN